MTTVLGVVLGGGGVLAVLTVVAVVVDHLPGPERRSVEEHRDLIDALRYACSDRH
jgi:hypothetical protein